MQLPDFRPQTQRDYLLGAIALVTIFTLIRILHFFCAELDLIPDEAQYYMWSKNLDWGFYSKPPLVAATMRLGTELFGDTIFGARFFSPLLHGFTALNIYLIAQRLTHHPKIAFYSALTYITLPAVSFSSMLMTTDPLLLFFWSLSLLLGIIAQQKDSLIFWILTGLTSGLGMLAKYNMIAFLASYFLYLFFKSEEKHSFKEFKNYKLWLAVLLAFLVYLPNLIWNYNHHFVSYLHTKDISQIEKPFSSTTNFFEFLFSQFIIFGPVLFWYLLIILGKYKHFRHNNNYLMLSWFVIPLFVVSLFFAFVGNAYANWAAPIYIAGTILVVMFIEQRQRFHMLIISILFNLLFLVFFMTSSQVASYTNNHLPVVHKQISKFYRDYTGWSDLRDKLIDESQKHKTTRILCDDRKTLAELLYQFRSNYLFTINKISSYSDIKDHYDMTIRIDQDKMDGNYLFISRDRPEAILSEFTSYKDLGTYERALGAKYNLYLVKKERKLIE